MLARESSMTISVSGESSTREKPDTFLGRSSRPYITATRWDIRLITVDVWWIIFSCKLWIEWTNNLSLETCYQHFYSLQETFRLLIIYIFSIGRHFDPKHITGLMRHSSSNNGLRALHMVQQWNLNSSEVWTSNHLIFCQVS